MHPLAHTLSVLLHPLLMPVITLWLAMRFDPHIGYFLDEDRRLILIGLVALMTIAFPLTSTLLLIRAGAISSLTMPRRQERILPYTLTLFYYGLTWYLLSRSMLHHPLLTLFSGAFAALALTTLITLWWKISAHMVGIGGAIGALAALAQQHALPLVPLLAVMITVAGVLGTARLLSSDHTEGQVIAGGLLGAVCTYTAVVLGIAL